MYDISGMGTLMDHDMRTEMLDGMARQRWDDVDAGGAFSNTSMLPFMNFALLSHIDSISPHPILFITGDIAYSRGMSEEFYAAASDPKELFINKGAMHIDLYDNVTKIPFDKLEDFFFGTLNIGEAF